jgi:hypothetical protein
MDVKMNERIKQLAEQAGLRFTQLMSNPMVPVVDGKETELEKFAELIVRECAKIADIADATKCEWIGGNILTRFGYVVSVKQQRLKDARRMIRQDFARPYQAEQIKQRSTRVVISMAIIEVAVYLGSGLVLACAILEIRIW